MTQQTREERLEYTLKILHSTIEGIKATVIVNIDGLLVAAYPPGDEENPHENPTSSPSMLTITDALTPSTAMCSVLRMRSRISLRYS